MKSYLPSRWSVDSYDLSANLIKKKTFYYVSGPIVHLINLLLILGIFPETYRLAKVIQVHKKGDASLIFKLYTDFSSS